MCTWIYADNLRSFLTILSWIVDYSFDPEEWTAIAFGVGGAEPEAARWYEYEFAGRNRAVFSLGADPGTSVGHVRVTVPGELESQVELAAEICGHFRVQE